jgi:hypothetical protein
MVENAVAFFYPDDPNSAAWAPQLLDSLSTQSWDVILANMKQLTSLTLRMLKSLYPWAGLNLTGEGFAVTYTDEEASRLMEDSTVIADRIVEMLPVDMS